MAGQETSLIVHSAASDALTGLLCDCQQLVCGASKERDDRRWYNGVQGQESGIRFAIVLWGELSDKCRTLMDCPVLTFADVLAKGHRASADFSPEPLSADQLATIVYTSGTTGNPKVCTGNSEHHLGDQPGSLHVLYVCKSDTFVQDVNRIQTSNMQSNKSMHCQRDCSC